LCLDFIVLTAMPAWTADLVGNVAKINDYTRSITLVLQPTGWGSSPTESLISVGPAVKFWRTSPDQADLEQAAGDLGHAAFISFENVSVGDRLLVRGDLILDGGASYVAFPVNGTSMNKGTFSVAGLSVNFSEPGRPDHSSTMSCQDFIGTVRMTPSLTNPQWETLSYGGDKGGATYSAKVSDKKAMDAMYAAERAITNPCYVALVKQANQVAEEREQAAAEELVRRAEADAREREAAAAKRAADFRNGILTALHAAEESDPFASIRGDFDLSGSDSRHWKTSLHLPGAEKCALLKAAAPIPTAASAWTFACLFRASGDGYERMVKSVQSVLNLPYVPDEKAVNMNQVFFADLTKPAWRFFAAKMKDAVGISVVAVRFAGGPATAANTTPFPTVPTMLPTDPTAGGQATPTVTGASISDEVEKIRSGRYTPLPPIQSMGSASSRNEMAVFEVRNDTAYTLTALFSGPIERRVEVAPGTSTSVELPPGAYKLAGRVNAPNVLPSYGEHTFDQSSSGLRFFLQ